MKTISYHKLTVICFITSLLFLGCSSHPEEAKDVDAVKTTVTVTHLQKQNISEYIQLNGVTLFQKKDNIRSNVTGYIKSLKFKRGDVIKSGEIFCTIGTKEQEALKNITNIDTSLHKFQNPLASISNVSGVITTISSLQGDYVSEGDILANVSEPTSLIVQVNVPYEYNQYVSAGKSCEIVLPDGRKIESSISGVMPTVDSNSQSQTFYIRLPNEKLPENLNVIILIAQKQKTNVLCIPTAAVQTDEMQKLFWVMKISNDSIAKKVFVKTGLQNDSVTEIISNDLLISDPIILQGAYGLADSTIIISGK